MGAPTGAQCEMLTTIIRNCLRMRTHLTGVVDKCEANADTSPAAGKAGGYQWMHVKKPGWRHVTAAAISLPEKGAGAAVNFVDYTFASEFETEDGGALKDVPPSEDEVRRFPARAGASREEHPKVITRLQRCGVAAIQETEPKCVNGYFGVEKSEGVSRFIADLRRANTYFKGSKVRLLNPVYLAELILEADKIYVAKTDIKNCFHMIRVPEWMSQYFGLPRVWSEDVGLRGTGRWVWPVLRALPMGFLRSVDIAQELGEVLAEQVRPSHCEGLSDTSTRRVSRTNSLLLHYIDDSSSVSGSCTLANDVTDSVRERFDEAGLLHHPGKVERAGAKVATDTVGVTVHEDGYLLPGAATLAEGLRGARMVCRFRRCSSSKMHTIVGQWTWALLLNRPLLSLLDKVYVFIEAGHPIRWVPRGVLDELQSLIDVHPMLVADLRRRPSSKVLATDASEFGQGVCYADLADRDYDHLASHAWLRGWATRHDGTGPLLDLDPRFAPVADFVKTRRWRTAVAERWRFRGDHITLLEARAVLTGLKWVSRQPSLHHGRLPVFVDSQACLGAFAKGRSSSWKLNRILRRTAAYICATDLRISWLWIPTADNPADKPSRA